MGRSTREYDVDGKTLECDAKLAFGVEGIRDNCGEKALAIIFHKDSKVKMKEVGQVSRMHGKRQRYEMQQAGQGKPIGKKPKEGIPCFDTKGFDEVVSRMCRFQGGLAKQVAVVTDRSVCSPDSLPKLPAELKTLIGDARQLRQMVKALATAPSPRAADRRRSSGKQTPTGHADAHRLWTAARTLHGVIEKCLLDIPRMPQDMLPTAVEKDVIDARLKMIEKDAKTLLGRLK